MKNLHRTAVIGCGGISRVHIAALKNMDGVRIEAVCDIRPERLQAAAEETGAAPYADWHEAIRREGIDTVHICLPHYLHAPVAIEALSLGKNVLTEKPMAIMTADARAMIAAAEQSAGRLGVVFQNRYNPAVQQARSLIMSGEMGAFLGMKAQVAWNRTPPYYTESGWRGSKTTEGAGVLINQSIHTLDLLSYLGGPIEKVRASAFTGLLEGVIEVEDNAMAVAVYEGGQRAVIHATNNNVTDAPVEVDIYMEKGALKLFGPKLYAVRDENLCLINGGDGLTTVGKSYWGTGHAAQISDFYACLDEGRPFPIDGRSGFPALALVRAILDSSDKGDWVQLEKV
ncbi:MAG: Gfo/Idh/MocA family oxidoreductase [Clostridia bacterium]|nr:Gfo/Idh/MocA family oxidoreductase [Clostridia bacterium]